MKNLEESNSESTIVVTRVWGREECEAVSNNTARGMRSYCLMGSESQFCKVKGVLEMNGGDGCTNSMNTLNTSEMCT